MPQPALGPKWRNLQETLWPGEVHGVEGDCPSPYCNYMLNKQDIEHAEYTNGHFECPQCGWKADISYMFWDDPNTRNRTRSGMTLAEMGTLGENVVKQYAQQAGGIPGLGQLAWESPDYTDPIDMVVGDYGLEVKSLHSGSFPRFKIAADPGSGGRRSDVVQKKMQRVSELSQHLGKPLYPGMLGVRLNFYTNRADFFFAPEFKDRMITAMQHAGYSDFTNLNPFKQPHEIAGTALPAQGETAGDEDIPF